VIAVPDANARSGHPSRFVLKWMAGEGRARRYGEASATVRVTLTHFQTTRTVERGRPLQADDVEQVRGDAAGLPLRPLPVQVIGARALRDLAAGSVITEADVKVGPLVKSGDIVVTIVRVEGIRVQGTAVAAQDGRLGQTIRVVNPASGRRLKATVTGVGEVEVIRGA